jgi:hypothetical protein
MPPIPNGRRKTISRFVRKAAPGRRGNRTKENYE